MVCRGFFMQADWRHWEGGVDKVWRGIMQTVEKCVAVNGKSLATALRRQ